MSDDLRLNLCVSIGSYAESDEDGVKYPETYGMTITNICIENEERWVQLDFNNFELEAIRIDNDLYNEIEENYLND